MLTLCSTSLLASGVLDLPEIVPGSTAKVTLPTATQNITAKDGTEVYLTVSFRLRAATPWAESGHEVAWFQHHLLTAKPSVSSGLPLASRNLSWDIVNNDVIVTGDTFTFVFDTAHGYLKSWTAGNVPILEADPSTGAAILPSFWRPPTDNDNRTSLSYWQRFGVDAMTSQFRSETLPDPITPTSDPTTTTTTQFTFTTYLSPPVLAWGYLATTTYTISATGSINVSIHHQPTGAHPTHVPRVGLNLRLPRRLDAVNWLGLGPGESYPDKLAAQRVGVWSKDSVADMHTPYEVPQEDGNRMGTRWVSVREQGCGGEGSGVRAAAAAADGEEWSGNCEKEGFSFRVGRYSDRAVQEARHPCDLVEEEATLLRLDGRVAGVGTGACGPAVWEVLLVPVEEMRFGFVLEAVGV
jgi:beta-galactosidase